MRARSLRFFLVVLLILVACRREEPTPTPGPATPPPAVTPGPTAEPTSDLSLLGDLTANPRPKVIGRSPAAAEELTADGTVEIYFDQPMDGDNMAAAWQFVDQTGQAVDGQISFPQPRILRFRPNRPLQTNSVYHAQIGAGATSAGGQSLLEGLSLEFNTIRDLAVSQVSPADGTTETAIDTSIAVIFNRPVVALTLSAGQADLLSPLAIDPPVDGQGEWVNTSVYIFRPATTLQGKTTYAVQVLAEVVNQLSSSGASLATDFSWSFTTAAPTYSHFELVGETTNPPDNFQDLRLDQSFRIYFNQPMERASTEAAVRLQPEAGGSPVPLTFAWNKETTPPTQVSTVLTITPTQFLEPATRYELSLETSAQATVGSLGRGFTWRAQTVPPPSIVRSRFEYGSFSLVFSGPMAFGSFEDRVIFDPPWAEQNNRYYDDYRHTLTFYGFAPDTEYTVTILPGMRDPWGNEISERQETTFRTPPADPYARFGVPYGMILLRQGGSTDLYVTHRNVDELDVAFYELSAEQMAGLLFGRINECRFMPNDSRRLWQVSRAVSAPDNEVGYARFDLAFGDGDQAGPPPDTGLYLVTLDSPQVSNGNCVRDQGSAVAVVNANVTLKNTTSEAMVWVTDLQTGQPLGGVPVTLFDERSQSLASGTTDGDGLISWTDLTLESGYEAQYWALAQGETAFGLAATAWDNNIYPYEFGVSYDPYVTPGQPVAYVYTDRPLYRPGQPVSFKGVVRLNDDLSFSLPPYDRVRVEIASFDETVYAEDLPLSPYGSFEGRLPLDAEATLGQYSIYVTRIGGDPDTAFIGSGYFDVAEYRKPTFQVAVTAEQQAILVGETALATVEATFFAGGALANADVVWYAQVAPFYFSAGGDLSRYSFIDFDQDLGYRYYDGSGYQGFEIIAQGQGRTDAQGRYLIELPTELLGQDVGGRQLTIEAGVVDEAGNQVSSRTTVIAHAAELYAGVRPANRIGTVAEPVTIEVVLVDWDGQPATGTATADLMERRWSSVQEEDARGNLIWRTEVEEIPVGEPQEVTVDSRGRGTVDFAVENGGVYKALITVEDSGGRRSQASTYLWVAGESFISWRRTNDNNFELIADRTDYRPGDTAELFIASPFQGRTTALITVERGHIKQYEVVTLENNSAIYRLPITGEMAPNVIVSVLIVQGADNDPEGLPAFKVGMVELGVDREEQELTVSITTDKTSAGPGDTVAYTIQVTDHAGAPVEAELSLALADLAALSLSARVEQPILDFFYSRRYLSVNTALLLNRLVDYFNQEIPPQDTEGGGGGKGDFSEYGVERIRQNFPDTAYWRGQLTTDAQGLATVSVTLPDNLTTWRMDVRAVTGTRELPETLVGQATTDIVATRPLRVQPQTPRFFIVGDQVQLGTLLVNNTAEPIEATVSLSAAGATLLDSADQTVAVPANGNQYLFWDATVTDLERVDLVFRVSGGGYNDASTPPMATLPGGGLPVYRYEVSETTGTAGQLSDAGAVVESIGLPVYPDWQVDQANVTVSIAPSLAAAMTEGLTFLEHFPYVCTEQTISRFLPNVLTTRALREAGLSDPALEARLQEQVSVAMQRLYSRQRSDGGWPWWDQGPSDPIVSAYVLLGLVEARDAGYTVSDGVIAAGQSYLRQNWRRYDLDSGRARYNRQAFLLYVLTRSGVVETASISLDTLYEERSAMDIYGRAFLAQTIFLMDDGDPRLDVLTADFVSQAIISATGSHWEEEAPDHWNWNTDTRTTAIVLAFMARVAPDNPLVANAVRWLLAHRTAGRWQGTQETAWVLMGLTEFMVASGELQADFAYEVALNGQLVAGGQANADTLRDTTTLQVDVADLFTDELNRLAIGRSQGGGNLYYTAHLQASIPVEQVQPLNRGVIISRSYYRPDDPETPIDRIAQGETFLARLTIVAPSTLHYLMVEDYLPAGLEAVDTSLLSSAQVAGQELLNQSAPADYDWDRYLSAGWGWWVFDHVELRDEKVALSAVTMPPGTYEYVYLVRALIPGTYQVIPPSAWELYFPEVTGRGAGSIFIVE